MSADVLETVHYVLLAAFVSVTLLLFVVTLLNRLRLRRVRLMWQTGRLGGWPAPPVAFFGLLSVLAGINYVAGGAVSWFVLAGYAVGGVFWLASSFLACGVVVTDGGIFVNADRLVAWGQVVDYFAAGDEGEHCVFLYLDGEKRRRLEVAVPARYRAALCGLLREKLDARFERAAHPLYDSTELEG